MALDAPTPRRSWSSPGPRPRGSPAAVEAIVAGLDAADARERPAPDEWLPARVSSATCATRETEDFGARLALIVDGGGTSRQSIRRAGRARAVYRDVALADALRAWRERRRATLDRLAALDPAALAGAGRTGSSAPVRLDLLACVVAHDRLHLAQLASTVARLWAETAGRRFASTTRETSRTRGHITARDWALR